MTIIRRLLSLGDRPATPVVAHDVSKTEKPDQLSVDVARASQQNNQAAQRVRETLSQMLAAADAVGQAKR